MEPKQNKDEHNKTTLLITFMSLSLMKKGLLIAVMLLLTGVAHAQLKKIVFTPQWHANIQFAGYIAARELGYYQEEGLDVTIKYPVGAKSSIELLRDGEADLSMALLINAITTKTNDGLDMVNVMQTAQHSSLCLALKTPVKDLNIEKLKGLRVGLWSSQTAIAASAMNKKYNLNWDVVFFHNGIKLLSYGVLDAISVMEYNELLRLKYTGRDVSEHSVFRLSEHGYDIPEEGVYCLREYYQQHANEVKAFIRASKKGWEWCRKHQEEAIDYVTKEMNQEYVYNSRVFQKAGLKVVLKKQELSEGKIGYTLKRDQYEKAATMLLDAGLINIIPDFQTFIAR